MPVCERHYNNVSIVGGISVATGHDITKRVRQYEEIFVQQYWMPKLFAIGFQCFANHYMLLYSHFTLCPNFCVKTKQLDRTL